MTIHEGQHVFFFWRGDWRPALVIKVYEANILIRLDGGQTIRVSRKDIQTKREGTS